MRNPTRLKNLSPRYLPVYGLVGIAWLLFEPHPVALALGLGVVGLGVGLRTWSVGHLVKRQRLSLNGPYTRLRHPLYAGTLLVCLGFALALGGWLAAAFALGNALWFFLYYFPRKERQESDVLERLYGGAYARYRAQVPALWPALSAWRPPHELSSAVSPSGGWSPARYAANNELGTLLAVLAGAALLLLRAALP